MSDDPQKPTGYSILEGTMAQALGGSIASVFVLTLASFHIFLAAGMESALGSLLSVIAYLAVKTWRIRQ
jgi:hypothetical protein